MIDYKDPNINGVKTICTGGSMFQITDIKGVKHDIDFSNFRSGLHHMDCMEALKQMPAP